MMVGMEAEAMTAAAAAAAASSECSSGCQSGWTMYLDHSCSSTAPSKKQPCGHSGETDMAAEEEDDLSMVSDASSGPPQLADHDDEHCGHARFWRVRAAPATVANDRANRRPTQAAARRQAAAAALLDDTASSPPFKCSKVGRSAPAVGGGGGMASPREEGAAAVDFSCAFSATSFKSHWGYMQMPHPAPVKPTPTRPVCRDGGDKKRW